MEQGPAKKKQGPKTKKKKVRRCGKKLMKVRQAVLNARKNLPNKTKSEAAPTSKPEKNTGADDIKPGGYKPGKFREARLEFIRCQMQKQSLPWKEASKLWLPSAERASLLQGMSKSELSKRRFNN